MMLFDFSFRKLYEIQSINTQLIDILITFFLPFLGGWMYLVIIFWYLVIIFNEHTIECTIPTT